MEHSKLSSNGHRNIFLVTYYEIETSQQYLISYMRDCPSAFTNHVNITTDASEPVVACSHLDDVVPTPGRER